MAAGPETLLRYIRRLVIPSEPDEATDAALLGRFISARDQRAFTALVDRHGPLVFDVCHRVLGDVHDAEDAFQATFLVLARKAAAVHPREALPAWLHGVARRVALKARSARARPFRKAGPLAAPPADPRPDPLVELSARELLMIIDDELQRLPEVYRLPVILCCLEGRTLEEAARQLGWTPGSVKGRLERGRARLHARLVRRGLTLSAALATAELSRGAGSATAVAQLVASTVRAAMVFVAGPTAVGQASSRAAVLAGEVVNALALARLKIPAALLLATGLLTTGLLLSRATPTPPATAWPIRSSPSLTKDSPAPTAPAAVAKNEPGARGDEADAPIEVSGRVFGPDGKPFTGAKLYVGYSVRHHARDFSVRQTACPLRATSGADGRFHFTFARSDLDARWLDDSRPAVVAVAGGYGPDWVELGESSQGAGLTLKLVEDLPVNGRILNQNRQPVVGAKVLVRDVLSNTEEKVTRFLEGPIDPWSPKSWRGPFPEQPPSATTDADGRFRVTGLGRDRIVSFVLVGPAIRHTSFTAVTRPSTPALSARRFNSATFEHVAFPSQSIRGVVRDRATGSPVAGVRLFALLDDPPAVTDENGRFEILGCPKMPRGYAIMAQPQAGQPYFAAKTELPDRPGFDPLTVDLDLVSGIPLTGQVTDQATGKPPRAAVVEYYPLFPNTHSSKLRHCPAMAASSALVRLDGSYSLAVLPGPGVVCVTASPRNSYAVAMVDDKELDNLCHDRAGAWSPDQAPARDGGQRPHTAVGASGKGVLCVDKYHALSLINPDEKVESLTLDLRLQPARRLPGTVVGPDGRPLTGVEVVGLTALPYDEMLDSATFTVEGLNPRRSRELIFRHKEKGLGKVLTLRGDVTGPLAIHLEPCGSITGRMVDKGGKPVPEITFHSWGGSLPGGPAKTDREGRFHVALLPGLKYSLGLSGPRRLLKQVGKIEVESGRSKDLGDLPVSD
jgi:RNA polymerase sigma factor (sigma-70 family)